MCTPPRTSRAGKPIRTTRAWVSGFRLKADFDITGFSPHVRAILKGLKKYGMIVADNGGDWRLSVAPDSRIRGLDELGRLKGSDFEVVETTGPDEGPRGK